MYREGKRYNLGCICFVKALNSLLEVTQYGDVQKLCVMVMCVRGFLDLL